MRAVGRRRHMRRGGSRVARARGVASAVPGGGGGGRASGRGRLEARAHS